MSKIDNASWVLAGIAVLMVVVGVFAIAHDKKQESVQDKQTIKDMQDEIDTLYRHLEECLPPKEGKIND